MQDHYADLTLYFGFCPSDGIGEFRFNPHTKDNSSRKIYLQGIDNVLRYLQPGWEFGFKIVDGYLVQNEAEAQKLIKHAEANVPDSHGLIELLDICHGSVRFFRKIRFNDAVESQRDKLIDTMKESSYIPKDPERERLAFTFRRLYKREELEQKLDEKGLGPDRMWKNALKFY